MQNLWGGRFQKELDSIAIDYTESIAVDAQMLLEDIWGSQAHVIMLAATGIINDEDLQAILTGLEDIKSKFQEGKFTLDRQHEDVHMNVERYLISQFGDCGGRMHTARSRNDQVITDTRLHVRNLIFDIEEELITLQKAFLDFASKHIQTITVGYTHTQHAQPISLGFWAIAYISMFMRDLTRLKQSYQMTNINPLGACALSGTSFPIDRKLTSELLGFASVQEHGLDAISSRDFALQLLSTLAILMSNLSKIAEEIIYWSTYEFGTIKVSDAFAMGSSIMPQKKNPGVAELIRGKTGKVYGLLMQLLTNLKATPSGYNRDLQEDKPPIWEATKLVTSTLKAMTAMINTLSINEERMLELTHKNYSLATEIADYLVKTQNRPFRDCHRLVGQLVSQLIEAGTTFEDIDKTKKILSELEVELSSEELQNILSPQKAVETHRSLGGTAPDEVKRMIEENKLKLEAHERELLERKSVIEQAYKKTASIVANILSGKGIEESLAQARSKSRISLNS